MVTCQKNLKLLATMNCTFEADTTSVKTGVQNTQTTDKDQSVHFGVFVLNVIPSNKESNKVEYLHCWPSTDPDKSTYKIIHKTEQKEHFSGNWH